MRIATILVVLMLVPVAAFPNGATYGGTGSDVYPVHNSNVSMREEHVRLTIQGDSVVSFDCTFHFVNHGEPGVVAMGFPLVPDGSTGWTAPDSAALGFRVKVDGKPAAVRRANLGTVLLWDVPFGEDEEKTVEVSYDLPWSWADMSLYPASISYVLKTGALWRDPIEHGVIEVVSGSRVPLVAFSFDPVPTSFEEGVARWEFRHERPAEDVTVRFNSDVGRRFEGRFTGPYDVPRLPPHSSARELLELVDGEWEMYLTDDNPDWLENGRTSTADSARVARRRLESEGRTRELTSIERLNLEYARAVERVCSRPRPAEELEAELRSLHERFW